jgi:cytosine/adenosine deaminase-related metal-dependent hydrolase
MCTTHHPVCPIPLFSRLSTNNRTDANSLVELYHNYGILDHHILFSHCNGATANDASLIRSSNAHLSSTPSTELQMALGTPVAFSDLGLQFQSSVGVDCHSNQLASIPSELRLLLQSSRALHNQKFLDQDKIPKRVNKTVEEAFNLGTIQGARAIGRENELGILKAGKKADILVWDATSPSMVCASEEDPVAAIILHSSPADLETVIIDGVIRKEGGKLRSVDFSEGKEVWDGEKGVWEWRDVSKELVRRRVEMMKKVNGIDFEKAREGVIGAFYVDQAKIVESV